MALQNQLNKTVNRIPLKCSLVKFHEVGKRLISFNSFKIMDPFIASTFFGTKNREKAEVNTWHTSITRFLSFLSSFFHFFLSFIPFFIHVCFQTPSSSLNHHPSIHPLSPKSCDVYEKIYILKCSPRTKFILLRELRQFRTFREREAKRERERVDSNLEWRWKSWQQFCTEKLWQ